jgi:hypothetical protein
MSNKILADLQAQVAKNAEVEASAIILIEGIAIRIQAAVDAAIANGATEAELAPVADEVAALKASATALGDAVAQNTSA